MERPRARHEHCLAVTSCNEVGLWSNSPSRVALAVALSGCRLAGSSHSWSASAAYPAKAARCDQGFELLHDTAPASRSTLAANCAPHVEAPGTKAASTRQRRPNAASAWACATAPLIVTGSCAMMIWVSSDRHANAARLRPYLRLTQRWCRTIMPRCPTLSRPSRSNRN